MEVRVPRIVVFSRHYSEYCFRYANALARFADVLLILDREDASSNWDVSALQTNSGLTVLYLNLRMRQSGIVGLLRATFRILRFRPDIVQFHEIPDVVTPLQIALFNAFTRTVLTVHDPRAHSGRDSHLASALYWLRDFGRRRAGAIVVHGGYCHKLFVTDAPQLAKRVVTSTHGVLMVPVDSIKRSVPGSLLFFGRMEEYKGLDIVYTAIKILIDRGIPHKIAIAGRGAAMDSYRDRLSVLSTVTLIPGFVSQDQTTRLFQDSSVVLLPYRDATQSGVLGAAFGNHRPVIASRVGGLPDIIKDRVNGLLIEAGDSLQLADAIQLLFEDHDLLTKLTAGAVVTAETDMNWNNITDAVAPRLLGSRVLEK